MIVLLLENIHRLAGDAPPPIVGRTTMNLVFVRDSNLGDHWRVRGGVEPTGNYLFVRNSCLLNHAPSNEHSEALVRDTCLFRTRRTTCHREKAHHAMLDIYLLLRSVVGTPYRRAATALVDILPQKHIHTCVARRCDARAEINTPREALCMVTTGEYATFGTPWMPHDGLALQRKDLKLLASSSRNDGNLLLVEAGISPLLSTTGMMRQ